MFVELVSGALALAFLPTEKSAHPTSFRYDLH